MTDYTGCQNLLYCPKGHEDVHIDQKCQFASFVYRETTTILKAES